MRCPYYGGRIIDLVGGVYTCQNCGELPYGWWEYVAKRIFKGVYLYEKENT